MQIPLIPNYNSLMHSGCSLKYANYISRKRMYISDGEYNTITIPIFAVFDWVVKKNWGTMHNFPLLNKLQHLSVDYQIDYDSFISLN